MISNVMTKKIASSKKSHSVTEIRKTVPAMIAKIAEIICLRMFLSSLKAVIIPVMANSILATNVRFFHFLGELLSLESIGS